MLACDFEPLPVKYVLLYYCFYYHRHHYHHHHYHHYHYHHFCCCQYCNVVTVAVVYVAAVAVVVFLLYCYYLKNYYHYNHSRCRYHYYKYHNYYYDYYQQQQIMLQSYGSFVFTEESELTTRPREGGIAITYTFTVTCRVPCTMASVQRLLCSVSVIIGLKGAIRDSLQSPHCAANRLQHVRSSGPGAIVCKSRSTHRAHITCNLSCYVPCGTKGQLSCKV